MKPWLLFSLVLVMAVGFLPHTVVADAGIVPPPDEYVPGPVESYNFEQPFGGVASVKNIGEYIQLVYQFALGIVGIIAVTLIMFGGVRWIAAAGNESMISEAKETITSAVTGLVIALLSYTILAFINPQILKTDVSIFKIPIPTTPVESMDACAVDSPLTETRGAKYCSQYGAVAGLDPAKVIPSTDLNRWITTYNTGGLSLTFIKGLMLHESGLCINAQSTMGPDASHTGTRHACGIMQVMPTTAKAYASDCKVPECSNPTTDYETDPNALACCTALRKDPEKGVCVGIKLLTTLKNDPITKGSETLIAAAYNGGRCGSGSIGRALCDSTKCPGKYKYECEIEYTNSDPYAQTRKYVDTYVPAAKALICHGNGGRFSETVTTTSCTSDATGNSQQCYCTIRGYYAPAVCVSSTAANCDQYPASTGYCLTPAQACATGKALTFDPATLANAGTGAPPIYRTVPTCK
jgi:soluble lytic murein transglycosylase-like protein